MNGEGSNEKFKYTERFIVNVPPPYYYINRVYQRRTEEALSQFIRDRLHIDNVEVTIIALSNSIDVKMKLECNHGDQFHREERTG